MSPLPSRAAALVAPLPVNGMAAAAMAPAEAAPAAAETAAVLSPAREGARDQAATVTSEAAAAAASVATPAGAGATSQQDAAPGAAASGANAAQAEPAPAVPTFVGKPATTTAIAHAGKPAATGPSPASAGSIGGALFALVLVVGLILALGWVARRMPGFRAAGRGSALRVVDSLTLGPRERVVLVAVGSTQLLLGVGAGGTRTLHTLAEPLPVPETGNSPAFAQLLAQHFGKKA